MFDKFYDLVCSYSPRRVAAYRVWYCAGGTVRQSGTNVLLNMRPCASTWGTACLYCAATCGTERLYCALLPGLRAEPSL
eukprot:2092160-Rhodomonas_salina.2